MPPNLLNVWHLFAPSGCRLLTVCYLLFLRYLCWWGVGPLGKMWVQRRLLEVSFTLTWPGSKGFTSARPGRSINLSILITSTLGLTLWFLIPEFYSLENHAVLWIRDVYPRSRILILTIPDPGTRISDPGSNHSNKRGGKIFVVLSFLATDIIKLKII